MTARVTIADRIGTALFAFSLAFLLAFLIAAGPLAARAQQPAPGARPAQPLDAVVIVQPEGERAEVSVAFSKRVPAADVKAMLQRLARLGGWRMSNITVEDESPYAGAAKQTSASAVITGQSLVAPGGFRLQPFVDAFSSRDRFELIYVVGPQPWFQGLTHFESPVVSVNLTSAAGPYRYDVVVHDHMSAIPKLPVTQAAAPSPSSTRAAAGAGQAGPAIWLLIVLAVCCGIAVYVALRVLANGRARARADARQAPESGRRAASAGSAGAPADRPYRPSA